MSSHPMVARHLRSTLPNWSEARHSRMASRRADCLPHLLENGFMARRAFYSFHYIPDNWRASQVRMMGVIDGNQPATDNDWETVKKGGDAAIQRWIDGQLDGKSVAIVLVGTNTAGRKWINYEINKA